MKIAIRGLLKLGGMLGGLVTAVTSLYPFYDSIKKRNIKFSKWYIEPAQGYMNALEEVVDRLSKAEEELSHYYMAPYPQSRQYVGEEATTRMQVSLDSVATIDEDTAKQPSYHPPNQKAAKSLLQRTVKLYQKTQDNISTEKVKEDPRMWAYYAIKSRKLMQSATNTLLDNNILERLQSVLEMVKQGQDDYYKSVRSEIDSIRKEIKGVAEQFKQGIAEIKEHYRKHNVVGVR